MRADAGEAELCRRCSEGDERAFAVVYERYARTLYGTALRMLKSPPEAEDAMQETFLTFYQHSGSLEPDNLGGWLHRVTVNHCLDCIRRRRRRSESALGGEGPAAGAGGMATAPRPAGLRVDIARAVERLPERARLVFLLHDVEGFKHREVAELLQISEGTSKSQLFRAREMLREMLGLEEEGLA